MDLDAAHRRDRGAAEELEPHRLAPAAATSTSSTAIAVAAGWRSRGARAGRGGCELELAGDSTSARPARWRDSPIAELWAAPLDLDVLAALVAIALVAAVVAELAAVAKRRWSRAWWSPRWWRSTSTCSPR